MSQRSHNKRHLDLLSLKSRNYAVVGSTKIEPIGQPMTLAAFLNSLRQCANDLKNSYPENVPVSLIVDWPMPIKISAVVPASQQGSLLTDQGKDGACIQSLEESSLAEAEEIAAATRKISMNAIDCGNELAKTAETRRISIADAHTILAESPNEKIARKTYARARGSENQIDFVEGMRQVGGNRNIPVALHGSEIFEIEKCHLQELSPTNFKLEKNGNDETWRKIQSQLEGNAILRGQDDSPVNTSLRYAEISRTPADISVCIAEKVATKQRWLEPVKISNPQEIFNRSRDQISHLEETIDT